MAIPSKQAGEEERSQGIEGVARIRTWLHEEFLALNALIEDLQKSSGEGLPLGIVCILVTESATNMLHANRAMDLNLGKVLSVLKDEQASETFNSSANTATGDYIVVVDDNFAPTDDNRYELGPYPTSEEALRVARKLIDKDLVRSYKPGMTEKQLYETYTDNGSSTFIRSSDTSVYFTAKHYAKSRCAMICRSASSVKADSQ